MQTELQNAFETSQQELREWRAENYSDVDDQIRAAHGGGRHAVVIYQTIYCPRTDAVMGVGRMFERACNTLYEARVVADHLADQGADVDVLEAPVQGCADQPQYGPEQEVPF